jgi:hypothetical protein
MGKYALIVLMTLLLFLSYFVLTTNKTNVSSTERNVESFQRNIGKNIANSAAQIAVSKIKDGSWSVASGSEQFFTTGTNNFQQFNQLEGRYRIKIRNDSDIYTIKATGIGGLSDNKYAKPYEVTVKLSFSTEEGEGTPSPSLPVFDHAVFANGSINLTGSSQITGNAGTNSTSATTVKFAWSTKVKGNFAVGAGGDPYSVIFSDGWGRKPEDNITGIITSLPEPRSYPLPPFPEFPTGLPNKGDFTTPWVAGETYIINADGNYNKIEATSGRTITIDMNGGDRILRTKILHVGEGKIVLANASPNSRLTLYVENTFTFTGSSSINNNGSANQVHMYYAGAGKVNLPGSTSYKGSMHIKRAELEIGGSGGILGHIISGGSKVTISGAADANVRVLYAPEADVFIGGSGKVKGALIGKIISIEGAGSVTYVGNFADPMPDLDEIEPESGGGSPIETITGVQILEWN